MEGVGSRLGRASSRYGPSAATTAVFSGPVRKWKRRWVHVSSSPSASSKNTTSSSLSSVHRSSNSNSYGSNNSRLLLCRWTPLSPATSAAANKEEEDEQEAGPPRRRFRYTPVVVLEDRNKAAKKVENDADMTGIDSRQTSKSQELNRDEALKTEAQDRDMTHLDLELSLKENNSDPESDDPGNRANAGGFWDVS